MKINYGECHCGCGEKTKIAPRSQTDIGWEKGKPIRYRCGHSTRLSPLEYIIDSAGCWIWQRSKDRGGYGKVNVKGKILRAHRIYYEKHKGIIPKGLQIDHLCRVPACVNPDHLEPVTGTENYRRGKSTKITMEIATMIRSEIGLQKDIGKKYGISGMQVG